MALANGTKLGRYEIRSKIGEGGMGEVYRAYDTTMHREVAIKVLPAALSADKDRLARFEQEAQSAGALNHPNILVIHHIDTHDGAPYIVSELLEGETLRERMGGIALPQRKAIDYALQTAQGLAAAHDKGIVHRDLKPENIFITKDGRVKILDFGLAKLTGAGDVSQSQTEVPTRRVNTDPGMVMGTIGYMSPEQVRGKPTDHRSDIFSFGAILYEMLSGRRAFRGESTADTISAILREDPPDLSGTNPTISPALERVVNHCLEKNPEERFHSARDLAFAVEAVSGTPGASTSAATLLRALPPPKRKTRELLAWAAAGLFLIAVMVLAWFYFRRPPAVEPSISFVVAMPKDAVDVSSPVISPDGRTLAFVVTVRGQRLLYVRPLASLEAQALPGTEDAGSPFWSPDNRFLGFFSNSKLKKIEVGGGPVQTLCDARSAYGGTWNADGIILISLDTKGINRVSAGGGTPTPVLKFDESRKEVAQAWPMFLPDGRHFLFQSWNGRSDDSIIFVAALDGSDRKLLLKADSNPIYAAPGYLLFARGSILTAQTFDARTLQLSGDPFPVAEQIGYDDSDSYSSVSVSQNGVMVYLRGSISNRQLVWFDRTGKQQETPGPSGEINDIVLSRDGKRLAMQRLDQGNSDIWLMDLARGVPSRFTFDARSEDNPVWSPDGSQIVFSSGTGNGDVHSDLYRKVSNGVGTQELLLKSEISKESTDWSSDGRFIVFQAYDPKTDADIWILPLFGDGQPYPFLQTQFTESQAFFSPDGRWLAYTSNESGRTEVYVQTFPQSGGKWLISSRGGSQPHWRSDGKEIFYVAPDRTLMAVEVNTSSTFETSAPKPLFATQVNGYTAPNRYVVTADGQRFLVNSPAGEVNQTPITVVLNWTSSLKR
jgi:serine/threonine protein kinase/Tol biopolymer transport system component